MRYALVGLTVVLGLSGVGDHSWHASQAERPDEHSVQIESEGGPSNEDVDRLIGFAYAVKAEPGAVLLHCQAGISRSTAAAAIILAVALGPGREDEALREVLRAQPEARPNARMIELADGALGRNGGLVLAAGTVRPAF